MEKLADRIAAKMALAAHGKDLEDSSTLTEWNARVWNEIDSQKQFPRDEVRKSVMDILSLGTMF